ncbi:hypothetical protein EH228_01645 [Erwinia endophytica]|uniref:hypothetical protein n=1 Tax=Erwinia endophytica TaxID=1563158 RepID=UPI001265E135|nr:hypothetical protein [Erwinia endophytica]KAB8313504.1 hypothetical protein EH228_01645 [Erwinia endophytica]
MNTFIFIVVCTAIIFTMSFKTSSFIWERKRIKKVKEIIRVEQEKARNYDKNRQESKINFFVEVKSSATPIKK